MSNGAKKVSMEVEVEVGESVANFDNNDIANMLATFLRNEPSNKPYLLPFETIQSLIKQSTMCRNDVLAMESFGCLLIICLRFATIPSIHEEHSIQSISFLQSIISECVVLLTLIGNTLQIVNPADVLDTTDLESIGLFETFSKGLSFAKDILRDATHQIRTCREPEKKPERINNNNNNGHQNQHPMDCFQLHSIYFMCAFALSHVAIVVHSSYHINAVPGLIEALSLLAFLRCDAHNAEKYHKLNHSHEHSRMIELIDVVNKLALVAMNVVLNERNLQEVRMVRSKLLKAQSAQSDVLFCLVQTEQVKRFLDHSNASDGSRKMLLLAASGEKLLSIDSCPAAIDYVADSMIASGVEAVRSIVEAKPKTFDSEELTWQAMIGHTPTSLPPISPKDPRKLKSSGTTGTTNLAQLQSDPGYVGPKEVSEYLGIKKHLRGIYLATRPLRKPRKTAMYFDREAVSKTTELTQPFPSLVRAVENLEQLHASADIWFCPRYLDPSQPMYWICTAFIENMYLKTLNGEGFGLPIQSKVGDLKGKVKTLHKQRMRRNSSGGADAEKTVDVASSTLLKTSLCMKTAAKTERTSRTESHAKRGETKSKLGQAEAKDDHHQPPKPDDKRRPNPMKSLSLDAIVSNINKTVATMKSPTNPLRSPKSKQLQSSPTADHYQQTAATTSVNTPAMPTISLAKLQTKPLKLDLESRLRLAKEEARIEVKLNSMEHILRLEGKNRADRERLKRIDDTLVEGESVVMAAHRQLHQIQEQLNQTKGASRPHSKQQGHSAPSSANRSGRSPGRTSGSSSSQSRPAAGPSSLLLNEIHSFRESLTDSRIIGGGESDSAAPGAGAINTANLTAASLRKLKAGLVSIVWAAEPPAEAVVDPTAIFGIGLALGDDFSKEASLKLARKYAAMNKARVDEVEQRKRDIADQQELEVGMAKARLQTAAVQLKEERKKEKIHSMALKKMYRNQEKELKLFDKLGQSEQRAILQDMNEREKQRIHELKEHKALQLFNEEMMRKERHEMEMVRLKHLKDGQEMEEIIRRIVEEHAMRRCEERRRVIESKAEAERLRKQTALEDHRRSLHEKIDSMTGRVRMGNFAWHHGKYSFYENVRPKPVEWYQYEDANGTPYYYDRLTNKTQYHLPTDAPIRHWTEDLRDAYDAEHGAGAYDQMLAEKEFMRSVNEDGGWYDENGEWIPATGYYDENGQWVAYEGYYDENGRYRKYAKVQGDLSFMV